MTEAEIRHSLELIWDAAQQDSKSEPQAKAVIAREAISLISQALSDLHRIADALEHANEIALSKK